MTMPQVYLSQRELAVIDGALVRYESWIAGDFEHDGEEYEGEYDELARLQAKIQSKRGGR